MKEKNEIIDFVNTTGKNIGKIQNTKLAAYFNASENFIRSLRKTDSLKLDCLYLGALCKANNVTKEHIIDLIQNQKKIKEEE